MDRKDLGDCLHFDHHGVVDEQIQSVMAIERDALVGDGDSPFSIECELACSQFVLQTGCVGGLEQTWSRSR